MTQQWGGPPRASRGRWFAALVVLSVTAACSSSTRLVRSWTAPDVREGAVSKVFVIGVSENPGLRRLYEDTFVADLREGKIEAEAGHTRILDPDPKNIDKDAVAASLSKDGFTHVLVTRVVSIEDRETYHPPSAVTVGVGGYPGYYGGWYPYMSMSYGYVTSPGYSTFDRVVSLETNLYDLATQGLVWSGMTETWVDSAPDKNIRKIIDTVIWDMRARRVL